MVVINPSSKSGVHIKNVAANTPPTRPCDFSSRLVQHPLFSFLFFFLRWLVVLVEGEDSVWIPSLRIPPFIPLVPDILICVDRFSDVYKTRNRSRACSRVRLTTAVFLILHSPSPPLPLPPI